ncbi:MAG: hypothetical protein CMH53_06595 [Myxococcales bacterium]|nr:hypothetical protein [Myxococcales bacterium]
MMNLPRLHTIGLALLITLVGCAKEQKDATGADKATGAAKAKVSAKAPIATVAPKVPAAPKGAPVPTPDTPAKADEDGEQASAAACGQDKAAPGCPGLPAKGQVGDNPAAAPAAKVTAEAAPVAGKPYGKQLSALPSVAVSELLGSVEEYVGKRVRVEGIVTDVCPMRGCWFNMAGDKPGTQIRFKVRDGVMVFPMSAKGQYAVAEGVVRKIPLNLAQTKRYMAHQAEEKGDTFDPASVKEPMTLVRLDGVGAMIRDNK